MPGRNGETAFCVGTDGREEEEEEEEGLATTTTENHNMDRNTIRQSPHGVGEEEEGRGGFYPLSRVELCKLLIPMNTGIPVHYLAVVAELLMAEL
jgi:hypothetical protein